MCFFFEKGIKLRLFTTPKKKAVEKYASQCVCVTVCGDVILETLPFSETFYALLHQIVIFRTYICVGMVFHHTNLSKQVGADVKGRPSSSRVADRTMGP